MSTCDQLAAIEARANAATEGPFVLSRYDHGGGRMFAQTANGQRGSLILDTFKEGDREFYAHSRTDVPALIALVREQAAKLDLLTLALEEADENCCCGVCGL